MLYKCIFDEYFFFSHRLPLLVQYETERKDYRNKIQYL